MKVEIISATTYSSLQEKLNDVLRYYDDCEVVDIKYTCFESFDEGMECSAMIVYKDSPLIRCKDCEHWAGLDDGNAHSCRVDALLRPANHFCGYGKRR